MHHHFTFSKSTDSLNNFWTWLLPFATRSLFFTARISSSHCLYVGQLNITLHTTKDKRLSWVVIFPFNSSRSGVGRSILIYSISSIKSNILIIINSLFHLTGFATNTNIHRKSITECSQLGFGFQHTLNWVQFMSECVWLVEWIKCAECVKKFCKLNCNWILS